MLTGNRLRQRNQDHHAYSLIFRRLQTSEDESIVDSSLAEHQVRCHHYFEPQERSRALNEWNPDMAGYI
eukprot:scaffold591061_cov24-Prasinocladus_malaysianus.AAC.1